VTPDDTRESDVVGTAKIAMTHPFSVMKIIEPTKFLNFVVD
jgi:hypothetical protein